MEIGNGGKPPPPKSNISQGNPVSAKFRQVSELYEKQFLREIVKAMRSTVQESGLTKPSQGELIFRDQLDQEYVEKWGAQGGIGIANLIYDQLVEKYGAQFGLKDVLDKPKGPIPLNRATEISLQRLNPSETQKPLKIDEEFLLSGTQNQKAFGGNPITNPWAGVLLNSIAIGDDEICLRIQHENNIQSLIRFRGQAKTLNPSQVLGPGEELGKLSPEAKSISWRILGSATSLSSVESK